MYYVIENGLPSRTLTANRKKQKWIPNTNRWSCNAMHCTSPSKPAPLYCTYHLLLKGIKGLVRKVSVASWVCFCAGFNLGKKKGRMGKLGLWYIVIRQAGANIRRWTSSLTELSRFSLIPPIISARSHSRPPSPVLIMRRQQRKDGAYVTQHHNLCYACT